VSDQESIQTPPSSISELQPKMQLKGTIKRIELYGAFVDIGLERDGMIHISQLSNQRVGKVSDVVKEGDTVSAWVTHVDAEEGRIGLSLVEPAEVEWKDLKQGQVYTGRIARMEKYGVFVDFGAERAGLLHMREVGSSYVRHPSELFREGDEIDVSIKEVDSRRKRIDLTMVDLTTYTDDDDEDGGLETASPMEMAFQKAQEDASHEQERHEPTKSKRHRKEQDQILARTLEEHGR
jgi:small subunit ribosomal protein S1